MTDQSKAWTIQLSDIDRIKVRLEKNGRTVVEFSVQYQALIRGHWRRITGYDNSHGSVPHRHVYYPNQPEYRQIMIVKDNNEAFTEALAVLKNNFMKIKENYILLIENVGEA